MDNLGMTGAKVNFCKSSYMLHVTSMNIMYNIRKSDFLEKPIAPLL